MESLRKSLKKSLLNFSSLSKVALVASSTLFFVACASKKEFTEQDSMGMTEVATEQDHRVASSTNRISRNQDKKDSKNNANYDYAASEEEYYSVDDQISQNTEEYQKQIENKFIQSLKEPLSTFSIDVDNASYSNARRFIQSGQLPNPDAVRIEEFINYFDYDYKKPTGKHPFSVSTEISTAPWNEKHKLVHVGIQGKDLDYDNLAPSNLVFLIDASGSMEAQNKLPLLRSSLKLLLTQLSSKDRIAIVAYAGAAGLVLESTPATETDKIIKALDAVSSGGSTAGGAGIQLAYSLAKDNLIKEGNNRVILCTDGDFNVGVNSAKDLVTMIETKRNDGIYLTLCGFGMGNYKDHQMEELSNAGNGNYFYIDNIQEAKKVFVTQMRATLFTIAKDVKIQIEFNPAKVAAYRLIGYENRMLAKEDFNDDKKDAGELGAGHTVTALYEIIPVGVKSEFFPSVDDLRYQKEDSKIKESYTAAASSDELLNLKLRYKKPDENTSNLIVSPLKDENIKLEKTSDNFRFSAAVAEFGMILRNSEFKSNASYNQVISLAKAAKGKDTEGYRLEFLKLVESCQLMSK
ncbi:von Willebrand factor type A domain-containing protein [Bernardetia sp. OM2101]|uniref:vWA domain-containing protein n=1 Tax=Bernardetia sp. OM2101 TaxID=3344876 RepID=UPI0035CF65B0